MTTQLDDEWLLRKFYDYRYWHDGDEVAFTADGLRSAYWKAVYHCSKYLREKKNMPELAEELYEVFNPH